MGYVLSPDRRRVLMIHRNRRPSDYHAGKYNGLGGKLNADEDVSECMRREIREESGIECTSMRLRGVINWFGFGEHSESWLGFVYVVDGYQGEPRSASEEGTLEWIDLGKLNSLTMWDGAQKFLPMVFDKDPHVFYGVMPYRNGQCQSWAFSR